MQTIQPRLNRHFRVFCYEKRWDTTEAIYMKSCGKPDPLIVFLSAAWVLILSATGLLAISQESITLGSRLGISNSEGLPAILTGFGLLGFALFGLAPFISTSPFKRLSTALLITIWCASTVLYVAFVR